jgi:vesicle-fusing ATPase
MSIFKVEIDSEAAEKLCVTRADFLHALENDVKPAFGSSQDTLDAMCSR